MHEFQTTFRITASPTTDHDGHISREIPSSPDTPEEIVYTMGNETETSDLEKSQSEGSIRSIRSPSILSSRRTKTPFEVVEIVIVIGINFTLVSILKQPKLRGLVLVVEQYSMIPQGGHSDIQSQQTELEILSQIESQNGKHN